VSSRLSIKGVEAYVDGDKDTVYDGEEIKHDAKPESTVKLVVEVENKFANSDDIDFENVIVTVTIDSIDDGDDLEDESDDFDLKASNDKKKTFEFKLPLKIDQGTYDVNIQVEGEDNSNVKYEDEWTIQLVVDKKTHEVILTKADLMPSVIKCSGASTLSVEAMNIGEEDEDKVRVQVKNSQLGISYDIRDIELDSNIDDDANTYSNTFTIDATGASPGNYNIEVNLYYKDTLLDDQIIAGLVVEDCGDKKEQQKDEQKDEQQQTSQGQEQQSKGQIPLINQPATASTESEFLSSPGYFVLLVLANVVVLGLVVMIIVKVAKP